MHAKGGGSVIRNDADDYGLMVSEHNPSIYAFDSKFSIIKNRFWQIKKEERLACKIAA